MRDEPLLDLIEPLVTAPPEGAPEYVTTAGQTLAGQGRVAISTFEPMRAVGTVTDDGAAFDVELASTAEGLLARCSCTVGSTGHLCPHSLATAFVIWEQAPTQRG